jgi:NTE family protein
MDFVSKRRAAVSVLLAGLAAGCVPLRQPNVRLDHVDPEHGYRPHDASKHKDGGRIWLFLAFSGGGTRAASFAHGVLEGLRDTQVVIDGKPMRLLDEVDTLSGVSGGSFPAVYYGLFGDRIFDDFEERFLRKNVQGVLVRQVLNPLNLVLLMTPYLSRSDLASRYYHKNVFDEATFADLAAVRGPRVHINATDLPSGNTVRFNQDGFDVICSDLDPFPIAYAVAASSAVPFLLSPITLRNYAKALASRETNPRGWRTAVRAQEFLDSDRKRYIHLVDGGISDNLGVRMPLDQIAAIGGVEKARKLSGLEVPDHVVMVVVNAETEPDPTIDLKAAAPSLAASLNLVSGSQIRRYNFESLLLAKAAIEEMEEGLSRSGHPVQGHFVEVSFDLAPTEEEQRYLKRIPTSFTLSDEDVDRLIAAGRQILLDSPAYRALVEQLQ